MNILEIVLLIITVLLVIRGFHEGILRMFFGLLECACICLLITQLNPMMFSYLKSWDNVRDKTHTVAERYVNNREEKAREQSENPKDSVSLVDGSADELPFFVRKVLVDELSKIDLAKDSAEVVERKTHEALVGTVEDLLLKGIAILLTLILASFVLGMFRILLSILGHLPIIHGTSKIVGAFMGFIESIILIWITIFLIQCFSATDAGNVLNKQVQSSSVLTEINDLNPFLNIF